MRLTCETHTGWHWFVCQHDELREPFLGICIMAIGAINILFALGVRL